MTLPDIPRLYTALAEWLACLLYLLALRPRFGRVGTVLLGAGWLVGMGAFLQLTGHVPLVWWIPCMMAAVAMSSISAELNPLPMAVSVSMVLVMS